MGDEPVSYSASALIFLGIHMDYLRKGLCLIAGLMFVVWALPSFAAPTKQFGITITSTCTGSSCNGNIQFTNLTPSGNSTINTVIISPPAGYTVTTPALNATVTGASPTGGKRVACPASWLDGNLNTVTLASAPNSVCISNMPSVLKAGCTPNACTWNMTFTATTGGAGACVPNQWKPYSFNGNSFNGDTFLYVSGPLPPGWGGSTDTTTASCSLKFVSGFTPANSELRTSPANAPIYSSTFVNSAPPPATFVEVGVYDGSNNLVSTLDGKTVTLTQSSGPNGANLGGNTATLSGGVATFTSPPTLDMTGVYTLTAGLTSGALNLTSTASPAFTVFGGDIFCGDPIPETFTNPLNLQNWDPGYATGARGKFNKDGFASCIRVPYSFTNNLLSNDTATMVWDTTVQRFAVFTYSVNGKLRPIPAGGFASAVQPQVAWDANHSIFVPGLHCLGTKPSIVVSGHLVDNGNMPAPYGTLDAFVSASATTIQIDNVVADPAAAPPAPLIPVVPFPVVMVNADGSGLERMTATSLAAPIVDNGNGTFNITYNVTRGGNSEGYQNPILAGSWPTHNAGINVMSSPFPIIPNVAPFNNAGQNALYTPFQQAHMCVQDYGVAAYGSSQVYDYATFIDGDDGGVKIGP